MFQSATRTASWCNTQPWRVYVASEGVLRGLAASLTTSAATTTPAPDFDVPTAYNGVYAERRRAAGYLLYEALGIARADRLAREAQMMRNYAFFGAPHAAIITTDRDLGVFGAIDCGAFTANVLRAAHGLGVQTVVQASIALYPHVVRRELGIPDDRLVVCAVAFGYADTSAPVNGFRTERAGLEDVVTFCQ